jgi:sodium/potassium/calcium exchanger 6
MITKQIPVYSGDISDCCSEQSSDNLIEEFSQLLRSNDRKKKQTNQTKIAAVLTCATIGILGIVSIVTHSMNLGTASNTDGIYMESRYLEGDDANEDYSQYTCDDIFLYTEADSAGRCLFAQTCNGSQGLFASFVFCNTWNLSLNTWCYILTPFLTIWLVLLFRMLGSTAEDFFSPSLEMFSMKMGLPPRFAGVTLLALGNGAADVSATVSAISQNPQEGYQMALGALTGAGMFVGTVVAGIVIVIAGGVKCRGALVRDLCMYVITLGVVYGYFNTGEIGVGAIHSFFWLYLSFVIVVLVADIYHRAVVLPRIRKEENQNIAEANAAASEPEGEEVRNQQRVQFNLDGKTSPTAGIELASAKTSSSDVFHTPLNSGLEERDSFQDDEASPHLNATQNYKKSPKNRGRLRRGLDTMIGALSNYDNDEGKSNLNEDIPTGWSGGLEVNSVRNDEHIRLHGAHGILTKRTEEEEESSEDERREVMEPNTSYRALMEGVDNICTIEGSLSSGMGTSWGTAIVTAKQELVTHFRDHNRNIWDNNDNTIFDKFFMTCELPFTIMRKVSFGKTTIHRR